VKTVCCGGDEAAPTHKTMSVRHNVFTHYPFLSPVPEFEVSIVSCCGGSGVALKGCEDGIPVGGALDCCCCCCC
jgi:hypothetical protein